MLFMKMENIPIWQKIAKRQGGRAGSKYCSNYVYDEDYEYYVCDINLDEDEMARFMSYSDWDCPYFQMDDEYAIVRKQN